jgi:hypothetical protein
MRHTWAVLGLFSSTAALASSLDATHVPMGWRLFDVGPFSFYAPPDVKDAARPGTPEDSYVREFAGSSMVFHFDYGHWSNDLTSYPSLSSHVESIDGKAARLVSFMGAPAHEFRFENFRASTLPKQANPTCA